MDTKYKNSKIYKLICNITNLIYIGSTIQPLCKRLDGHKSDYKNWLNKKKKYTSSYLILENNNYEIILIEKYECNCIEELRQRERYWIEQIECVNICKKPFTSIEEKKEYFKNWEKTRNRIYNKEYYKEYYNKNINKILNNKKEKIECEICNSLIRKHELKRHQRSIKCLSFNENNLSKYIV